MKKLTCLLLLYCIAVGAHAQQWSAGFLTGTSYWMDRKVQVSLPNSTLKGQHMSWEKSLFARYETKKRLAFQARLSYDRLAYSYYSNIGDWENAIFVGGTDKLEFQFVALDLTMQYDITCPHFSSCPVMKNFKSYMGLTMSHLVMHTDASSVDFFLNEAPRTNSSRSTGLNFWIGLTNTTKYAFSDHLDLIADVNFLIDPAHFFNGGRSFYYNTPDSKFSFQFGAAYKF